jgi:hypothetical protein
MPARARHATLCLSFLVACAAAPLSKTPDAPARSFSISFAKSLSTSPIDGRLILVIAKPGGALPVFEQLSDEDDTAQAFGVDVEQLSAGQSATIDASVLGYPLRSLNELPPGDYVAQALLNRYETFSRGDGHTVKLAPDRGEGQDWKSAPGNLISEPLAIHIDANGYEQHIELSRAIPALPPAEPDTQYVKHVKIQSERLTRFWGRPIFLGAMVLLPAGFESHPEAHYPVVIEHGHFERDVVGWRETPPDPKLPPVDLARLKAECPNGHEKAECGRYGYDRLEQEHGYAIYQAWTGKNFPRVISVTLQHANAFYDDSYAVNSANLGPYGDAITYELIPYLEKTYRGLGPWARAMMGGSTGGWEALAAQIFYPDQYNGAVANCPDPIDFRAYMTVDIYRDTNAYFNQGPFRRSMRPASRDYLGNVRSTVEQENLHEAVLGSHGRSGQQWDIWQAVFSPVGIDGYPKAIWNKETGVIDREVSAWWREHYDLGHILERDWKTLEPKLRGKLAINVGLSDNYFLNDAVYLVEEFLKSASPRSDAQIDYGERDEHCWSGDHANFNGVSRLTYRERFIPRFVEHWLKTAPADADVTSWRY